MSAAVVASISCSVEPSSERSGIPSRPPRKNPTANPDTMRGKRSFICRTSRSRPAWPPMNTKPSWSAIGNATSRTAETQTPPARRITHDAAYTAASAPRRDSRQANESGMAGRSGDEDRDARLPTTAVAMYVAGSHSDPYASRNSALAGMTRRARVTPKASAWAVSRPTTPRGGALVTGLGRPVRRSRVSRPTSTAITPWASSGQSASRSSSTALSRRRRSVGSRAVTDARPRLRNQGGQLTHGDPRTELDDRLVAAMDTDAAVDDGVEVRFDRTLGDQHVAGSGADLGRWPPRRRRALGPGPREEVGAVQRGDALDEAERGVRGDRWGVGHQRANDTAAPAVPDGVARP